MLERARELSERNLNFKIRERLMLATMLVVAGTAVPSSAVSASELLSVEMQGAVDLCESEYVECQIEADENGREILTIRGEGENELDRNFYVDLGWAVVRDGLGSCGEVNGGVVGDAVQFGKLRIEGDRLVVESGTEDACSVGKDEFVTHANDCAVKWFAGEKPSLIALGQDQTEAERVGETRAPIETYGYTTEELQDRFIAKLIKFLGIGAVGLASLRFIRWLGQPVEEEEEFIEGEGEIVRESETPVVKQTPGYIEGSHIIATAPDLENMSEKQRAWLTDGNGVGVNPNLEEIEAKIEASRLKDEKDTLL